MLDILTLIAAESAHGAGKAYAEPAIAGVFNATVIVSLAMLVLIGIMVWKKVPAMIVGMLDGKIAAIRSQLDEAKALRTEAEALRNEYQGKLAALDGEAAAMRTRAEAEAAALVAKAEEDATALVARRQRMAEDRIAAAERSAIAEVRETASRAAVAAARTLIAERHDAGADKAVIDRAVADIARI
jgi:F-type H+-transporting ATPase subunit b